MPWNTADRAATRLQPVSTQPESQRNSEIPQTKQPDKATMTLLIENNLLETETVVLENYRRLNMCIKTLERMIQTS